LTVYFAKRAYQEYAEETTTDPKKKVAKKFAYAAMLIKSPDNNQVRNGIALLEGVCIFVDFT